MDPEGTLLRLATKQYLVFTHEQAVTLRVPSRTIRRRVETKRWQVLHRGVYATAVLPGWQQPAIAACFACGTEAIASHASAEAIWEFVDLVDVPHVTLPARSYRERRGIEVHRSRRLDAVWRRGFRVTHPMRTLLDLAPFRPELTIERYLDSAHRRGLVAIRRFQTYLDEPTIRRRPRAGFLRELLSVRDPDRPIESDLETVLFAPLRVCGLPLPVPQYWVETRHGPKRIDFAYPDHKLALEADGWDIHGTPVAFEADRARQRDLEALGWHVFPFTWKQLRADPIGSACEVGLALGLHPIRWKAVTKP